MKRVTVVLAALLAAVAVMAGAGSWLALRASLPALDGEQRLDGLAAPVTVARDALGVVTISGETRVDVALATGYVHAQERFFQMDLQRRDAAGELATILGPSVLERDRNRRLHRLRDVAGRVLTALEAEERALLEAYAAGARAGLAALDARPVEYLLLRAAPEPWRAEDSILVILGMFLRLSDEDASYDAALGHLREALPRTLLDFLVVRATEWDVPLAGEPPAQAPIPGPAACDLRDAPETAAAASEHLRATDREPPAGSNAWALGRERTGGAALVANDMHLGLGVPNVWFRARLVVAPPGGAQSAVTGATLPGTPAVIAGSNGRIAWGLTNSLGDWTDLVEIELDPDDAGRSATGDGYQPLERVEERIEVRGQRAEILTVRLTRWGPMLPDDPPRAARWIAHGPDAIDLGILGLESARDVPEAIAIAQRSGVPPLNFVVGDAGGRIGWTIAGRIPARAGHDGRFPLTGRDHAAVWSGWQPPDEYPSVVDPPGGRIWSANARMVFGRGLEVIGEGNYVLAARAHQVRAGLLALDRARVGDMLRLQLDHDARFLSRWRELALATGRAATAEPRRAEVLGRIERWEARAAVDSVGYRLVHAFRDEVLVRALGPLLSACGDARAVAAYAIVREAEAPLWRLVSERPLHLLHGRHGRWDDLLLEALDAAITRCKPGDLAACTWGEVNRVAVAHPLSRAVPALSRWLDVQHAPLPGDEHMPLAQKPRHGPSQRFAVAPGAESEGYFHMPGGQSGHPLSPWYRAGHDAWARGEPLPFLPGPTRHLLVLVPGRATP